MTSSTVISCPHNAELAEYHRQFQAIVADVTRLTSRLDDAQLSWSPQPGRWSIIECLDHLNIVAERMLSVMELRVEEARARGLVANGPFRHSLLGRFFVRMIEPPYKFKVPVPIDLVVAEQPDPRVVLDRFMQWQDECMALLSRADGLDLAAIVFNSPFRRPLRLSLGLWFAFIAAHERRHLWQAWNVRYESGFPGSSV